jgi:hypothetical protein
MGAKKIYLTFQRYHKQSKNISKNTQPDTFGPKFRKISKTSRRSRKTKKEKKGVVFLPGYERKHYLYKSETQ